MVMVPPWPVLLLRAVMVSVTQSVAEGYVDELQAAAYLYVSPLSAYQAQILFL